MLALRVVPPSVELHVAAYDVITGPFAAGGVTVTRTVFIPATATLGAAGVPGAPSTRVATDEFELGPVPAAFELAAVHEYAMPSVSPETITGLVPLAVWVAPPGPEQVTCVESIAAPLAAPSANETLNALAPLDAMFVMVGAPGRSAEMNAPEAAEGLLVPSSLEAVPVHVYVLPSDSPLTVTGDDDPVAVCVAPPSLDAHVIDADVTRLYGAE